MTSAEKRLNAAQERVQDAEARYATAESEWRQLRVAAETLDSEIQRRVYDATSAGEAVDVTADRRQLGEFRERLELMTPVGAALMDGLRRRREERDRVTAESFPELAAGVARDGEKIHSTRAEIMARFEAELAPLDQAERELRQRWEAMTATLPQPLRPPSLTADLEPHVPEPDVGYGRLVVQEEWPEWLRIVVAASRNMHDAETEPLGVHNMPMGV